MPDVAIASAVEFEDPFGEPDYEPDDAGTEQYYRFPNGEIKFARVGPETDGVGSEERKFIASGCTPLKEYGTFKVQPYHMDRPFEVLFQRGGAKELKVKEIIDQGLYFRPPLVPLCNATMGESWKNTNGERGHKGGKKHNDKHTVRCWKGAQPVKFPQLADEKIAGPFTCKWCTDDDTGDEKRFATERGLKNHQGVVHPEEIGSDRLAGQLITGLKGGAPNAEQNLDLRGEMLKMQEEMERMREQFSGVRTEENPTFAEPQTYSDVTLGKQGHPCDVCGKVCANAFGLNAHKRSHAKALAAV